LGRRRARDRADCHVDDAWCLYLWTLTPPAAPAYVAPMQALIATLIVFVAVGAFFLFVP
jgi:hypothetical protein